MISNKSILLVFVLLLFSDHFGNVSTAQAVASQNFESIREKNINEFLSKEVRERTFGIAAFIEQTVIAKKIGISLAEKPNLWNKLLESPITTHSISVIKSIPMLNFGSPSEGFIEKLTPKSLSQKTEESLLNHPVSFLELPDDGTKCLAIGILVTTSVLMFYMLSSIILSKNHNFSNYMPKNDRKLKKLFNFFLPIAAVIFDISILNMVYKYGKTM